MVSAILCGFWAGTTLFGIFLSLLMYFDPALPQFFKDLLVYGKVRGDRQKWTLVRLIEVPKGWFTHFYAVGVVVNGYAAFTLTSYYVFNSPLPDWIMTTLAFLQSNHQVSTDSLSALLLVYLMLLQNTRRLYECVFHSTYSKSTMNILHYALGLILYSTFFLVVLSEAPLDSRSYQQDRGILKDNLTWRHAAGVVLFLWSSFYHHVVHAQLGNLRRDSKGKVVTMTHVMPRGGWFELISCPHFFMEILIYLSFIVVGGGRHLTLYSVAFFAWSNQIIAGLLNHAWYKSNFKEYPPQRKAVIPYLL